MEVAFFNVLALVVSLQHLHLGMIVKIPYQAF